MDNIDSLYNVLNQLYNHPGSTLDVNSENYALLIDKEYIRKRNPIKLDSITLSESHFLTRKGISYLRHFNSS